MLDESDLEELLSGATPDPDARGRRAHPRRVITWEVALTTPLGRRFTSKTTDVSIRGFSIGAKSNEQVPVVMGMVCDVVLTLDKTTTIQLKAELVRIERGKAPPPFDSAYGFRIALLTHEQHGRLVHALAAVSTVAPIIAAAPVSIPPRGGPRLWVGVALLLIGAGAMGVLARMVLTTRRVPVTVARVTRGEVVETAVSPAGEITAEQRIIVRSLLDAPKVLTVDVKRGDRVKAGDTLARFDATRTAAALTAATTRLAAAEAHFRQAHEVASALSRNIAEEERSASTAKLLEGSRASLADARAQLEARTAESKRSFVRAPFDGVIAELKVHSGDLVAPAAEICELVDDSMLHAHTTFDEASAARIKVGMTAQVTVVGVATPLTGTVDAMGAVVRQVKTGRFVDVEIALAKSTLLRPGTSAKAEIVLNRKNGVLYLPRSAVPGDGLEGEAYVVGADQKAERRQFSVGTATLERLEIKSGLQEGDAFIVDAPGHVLAPGTPVVPNK